VDAIRFEAAQKRIAGELARIGTGKRASSGGGDFGSMLKGLVEKANDMQGEASGQVEKLVRGEKDNVHEVMLAVSKADLSFKMMLEVRNKLLDAYTEVMRMQV
jgi:flagellar hook-basal body complex protein FliE